MQSTETSKKNTLFIKTLILLAKMVNYKDFCANNNNIMKNYFKGQFADFLSKIIFVCHWQWQMNEIK